MMVPDWWRWTKAAPTYFRSSSHQRIAGSVSDGPVGRGKTRSVLKSAFVGSEGRLSGRGSPARSRTGNVRSGHGLRSEAMLPV